MRCLALTKYFKIIEQQLYVWCTWVARLLMIPPKRMPPQCNHDKQFDPLILQYMRLIMHVSMASWLYRLLFILPLAFTVSEVLS